VKATELRWVKAFSTRSLLCWSIIVFVTCAAAVALVSKYPPEQNYSLISAAIRHWDFRNVPPDQPREFWGMSYLSALLVTMTGLSDRVALIVISFSMYLVTLVLCFRLWGATITAWFTVADWWWLQSTVGGGSEPLFMALLLGAFLAVRQERWTVAALLASLSTVVRPVGIFALIAMGIVLLARKDLRRLATAILIALLVGALYVLPMISIYGSPLASVRSYQAQDWATDSPVTIPLLPIVKGALETASSIRVPLEILIGLWVLITLVGFIKMSVDKTFREYSRQHPTEAIFAFLYGLFIFSYDANFWAWEHFPRFALPLLPFILLVFLRRLPTDRRILSAVALVSIICVVLPKAGLTHVHALLHKLIAGH
jgi:hypothetical protein